jgi:hypothetical protein
MTQLVVQGMQAPSVFTLFLLLNVLLLGLVLASQYYVNDKLHDASTEMRLMQNAIQNQTAVMIREGITKPNDLTDGPTAPRPHK